MTTYKKIVLFKEKQKVFGCTEIRVQIRFKGIVHRKDDMFLISPDCCSTKEVHYWADVLIEDLEKVKKEADKIEWHSTQKKSK